MEYDILITKKIPKLGIVTDLPFIKMTAYPPVGTIIKSAFLGEGEYIIQQIKITYNDDMSEIDHVTLIIEPFE